MHPAESRNEDDRRFFEKMYTEHRNMMFNCALSILKTREPAEDALQQVFLNLWKNVHKIKNVSPAKLTYYLYSTTKNTCLNILKNQAHSEPLSVGNTDIFCSEISPELIFMNSCDRRQLLEAFDEIPIRYRRIIIGKAILYMTDEQAAELVGIKPSYVRECLYRARLALRAAYSRQTNEINRI